MTTKQEKHKAREMSILSIASEMITEEGFFNLRMTDLAKKSAISVGTLYVHFESKEDLLIGIGIDAIRNRYKLFKYSYDKYSNSIERLSAILICDHIINEKVGEISEIERLAQFPSVWKRASYRRMEEMNLLCQNIGEFVRSIIETSLDSGDLRAYNDKTDSIATCINISAWGVCIGMHHVFNSYCVKSEGLLKPKDIEHAYVETVHALISGFGYKNENFKTRLYEIYSELKKDSRNCKKECEPEAK
ncbi:MAG: TetR/AcrR family transcriptional regulator [Lentisphaeraceae bacterium]|nr:TetR/AcrR family transcriptional regulator [Lentisphaeraceae bacterium]